MDGGHIEGIVSAEGHALSSRISESLPFIESGQTDEIDLIVAEVQGLVVNPRPNATGRISEGRGDTKEYRYTTLDRVLDIARDLLFERGVVVRNFLAPGKYGYDVVTLFRHSKSGQYVGAVFPSTIERGDHRQLGAALTIGRRYNMTALLNIATEDDSDIGGGQPDATLAETTRRVAGPNASPEDMRKWLADGAWVDAEATPALGLTLLKALHANADIFDREKHPGLAGAATRDAAIVICSRFLCGAYNNFFGLAWEGVLRCKNRDEVDAFRVRYDTDLKAEIDKLRGTHNGAVAYLTQHLIVQAKRAEARAELETEITAVEAAAPVIPDEAYSLVGAYGDAEGDEQRDPVDFANAYATLWLSYDQDERNALAEHNDTALLWVAEHPQASKILEDRLVISSPSRLHEADEAGHIISSADHAPPADTLEADSEFLSEMTGEPTGFVHGTVVAAEETDDGAIELTARAEGWDDAPLRERQAVMVPATRSGTLDLARYYDAVTSDLESVNDVPTMSAWLSANEPVYRADGFPIGTRTKIIKLVLGRKRLLGMSSEDA